MSKLQFFDSDYFKTGLKVGSNSERTAKQREAVYFSAVENLNTLRSIVQRLKMFDDTAMENMAPSQMGIALAEASLKANINSIAGYIAIERPMTQMSQQLVYRDIVTKAGANVMPLIGKDEPRNRAQKTYKSSVTGTSVTVSTGVKLVPGNIAITLTLGTDVYTLQDNRNGKILSEPGVIDAGQVNYDTGKIELTLSDTAPAESKIKVCYVEDQVQAGRERTTLKQGYFQINASVNKFEFEADLITAMISQTTVGGDVVADLQQSVQDEQTIAINDQLVNTLKNNYAGNTLTIDLSAFSIEGGHFDSMLKVFNTGLGAVDRAIAKRCYKVIEANAYVVGNGLAVLFNALEGNAAWVPNNTGYVNGILGFYRGRAVIAHMDLADYEGYAIHKTADGQLAPLGYGILLPATTLPLVGNFNATNEVAGGIYSVDGTNTVALDLAQRFVVSVPADWMLLA